MQLEIEDLPKHLLPLEGNKMGALVYAMTFLNDSNLPVMISSQNYLHLDHYLKKDEYMPFGPVDYTTLEVGTLPQQFLPMK